MYRRISGGLHTLPRPYKVQFAKGTDDRTYHKSPEMAHATVTSARGGASSVAAAVRDASPWVPLHLAYGGNILCTRQSGLTLDTVEIPQVKYWRPTTTRCAVGTSKARPPIRAVRSLWGRVPMVRHEWH